MSEKFYITIPIFYPNAELHMGHAYTATLADTIARYHRLMGKEVYFLTGADENTEKVVRAAKAQGKSTAEYLDEIVSGFKKLFAALQISADQFIRTSDTAVHHPGAILMWKRMVEAGDIEKRSYEGLYCVGHEAFMTEKDLVDGKCPDHGTAPEFLKEENYFFKLSKYSDAIKQKIAKDELRITPESRKNEILAVLERGLEDVSFSRPSSKMSVGIPVPGDPSQKMYVWCDALVSYMSALGFGGEEQSLFTSFWPANLHVIGKDILRFHAGIWPGMLLSAKLPLPKALLVHGFINSGGRKMSKTLGNVISPNELIKEYGADAVRYYLIRHISPFEDGDVTLDKFREVYNADLANGLGNLVSRVMKMAETHLEAPVEIPANTIPQDFKDAFQSLNIQKASDIVWEHIARADHKIQETAPFKLIKEDKAKAVSIIRELVVEVYTIARMLNPMLPETMEKIKALVKANKAPQATLFPRKE